jgi:phospholipid-transporting ATPase
MPPDVESGKIFGCAFLSALGAKHHVVPDRVVKFPPKQQHKLHGLEKTYAGNKTTTTKYGLLTFIPKSLFEQYRWAQDPCTWRSSVNGRAGQDSSSNHLRCWLCRRVANIYFTLVAALSLTPYSPVR